MAFAAMDREMEEEREAKKWNAMFSDKKGPHG